jgi:hypothetical protein
MNAILADRELRDLIERVALAYDLLDLDGDISVADFSNLEAHQRVLRMLDYATIALRDAVNYLAEIREKSR